jgi:hypothetical protein
LHSFNRTGAVPLLFPVFEKTGWLYGSPTAAKAAAAKAAITKATATKATAVKTTMKPATFKAAAAKAAASTEAAAVRRHVRARKSANGKSKCHCNKFFVIHKTFNAF